MKSLVKFALIAALMLSASNASATPIATTWTSVAGTSGTGVLDGIDISATSSATSLFVTQLEANRFIAGGGWDAVGYELQATDMAIVASEVNAGDSQHFTFSSGFSGLLYIENFDSSSIASITATGAHSLALLASSPSVSFSSTGANSGTLSSSNTLFNGEGDAVIGFFGPVTAISLDYTGGEQANGVMYTFAINNPEPSSAILGLMAGLGLLSLVRQRRH